MNIRELLLGPAYYHHKHLLNRSRHWSPAEAEDFQRRQLDGLGISITSAPILDKDYYRAHLDELDNRMLRLLSKRVTTGGTSGAPFAFYLDRLSARQKERAYIFDIWSSVGYSPFDLRVVLRGNTPGKGIEYGRAENAYVVSPSMLNAAARTELLKFLQGLGPFFLHVYPSSLISLIDALGPEAVARLPIRGVMAGSEVFPASQMHKCKEMLACGICHWYGHSEYAVLAYHCGACGGFHFYPTYGLAEFEPAGGGYHEIIATGFRKLGTRFIRYRTEDLVTLDSKTCPVSGFSRVETIVGRSQEYIVDRDGLRRAFGPLLFGIHGEFWDWIKGIQFIQRERGTLVCRAILADPGQEQLLEDFLRSRLSMVDLVFEYVEVIPKTPRGKHRYFLSELTH